MLGLRVGYILGVFEALRYYQHAGGDDGQGEESGRGDERDDKIWREAGRELKMDRIFGEEFFDRDGVWMFDIGGRQGLGDHGCDGVSAGEKKQGEEGEEKGEEKGKKEEAEEEQKGRELITFFDVADSHPLIKEWMQKAKDELKRCGFEDRGTIEMESQLASFREETRNQTSGAEKDG